MGAGSSRGVAEQLPLREEAGWICWYMGLCRSWEDQAALERGGAAWGAHLERAEGHLQAGQQGRGRDVVGSRDGRRAGGGRRSLPPSRCTPLRASNSFVDYSRCLRWGDGLCAASLRIFEPVRRRALMGPRHGVIPCNLRPNRCSTTWCLLVGSERKQRRPAAAWWPGRVLVRGGCGCPTTAQR